MYTYTLGGKNGKRHILRESDDLVAIRTRNSRALSNAVFSAEGKNVLKDFEIIMEFPEADITVVQAKQPVKDVLAVRNKAKSILGKEAELRFAGKVLVDEDGRTLVLYTENIFIKFHDRINAEACEKILKKYNLKIKQRPDYAKNAFFASAPENTGVKIFEIAEELLILEEVELCHPELIRKRSLKRIDSLQWHLMETKINGVIINAGVRADKAQEISSGDNIVIAIIDDGFDIDHTEFKDPGKVIDSRDVTSNNNNPRPRNSYNNHGTACAGVAAAAGVNASGVAPGARLMPIRLSSNLGSMAEAVAFKWAADHGADIISCSWGPEDGNWSDPADPLHTIETGLPDSTRLAIDYAVGNGRNGMGCVVLFAAGNGNENVKYDGYASYEKVMAVAASNDTDKRCVYSDFGEKIWCCFPSSDFGYSLFSHPEPLTNGIYTTDRTGSAGYNPYGDYMDNFGGTSSSCPGVAGTIALILSANQSLNWLQIRQIIKETSDKIDKVGAKYDKNGHSIFYGFGKVNAEKAVKMAVAMKSVKSALKKGKKRTFTQA